MNGSSAVIEIKDVVVSYREKLALNGVTLTVHPGEFIGIIGPNGAGKTTLLTVINGLGRIISGSVCVLGQDLTVTNRNSLRKRIGYVSQADNIDPRMPMSVHDVVMTGRYGRLGLLKSPGASDKAIINDTLESVGMSTLSGRPIGHLSGGEQQRVAIARCLAQEPELFLLDEPTASIDWRAKTEILELVKKIHDSRHLTTLFVTHELSSLPSACSRVLLMKNGLILGDGPTRDLLTDKNLSDLYDVSVAEVRKKREDVAF
jgi:ABC-type Mn2+/Zn2+ transport system ATPase subunit